MRRSFFGSMQEHKSNVQKRIRDHGRTLYMKFYYIQMYVTFGTGGGSAEFSSVELLIG